MERNIYIIDPLIRQRVTFVLIDFLLISIVINKEYVLQKKKHFYSNIDIHFILQMPLLVLQNPLFIVKTSSVCANVMLSYKCHFIVHFIAQMSFYRTNAFLSSILSYK